jgi:hypothetical protein
MSAVFETWADLSFLLWIVGSAIMKPMMRHEITQGFFKVYRVRSLSASAFHSLASPPCRLVCIHLVALIALAFTVVPANAVVFRLGGQVLGGVNSLTGDLPEEGSWEGQFGLGAGVMAELDLIPGVALGIQPAFVQRGSRRVFENRRMVIGYIDYDLSYISLPLMVRVSADQVGVRGFVTAGLDFGILVDATATGDSDAVVPAPNSPSVPVDISDRLDSTTIGALFGAGVIVPVERHLLSFELRYSQGLDDIIARDNSNAETEFASPSVKYRGFSLLIGFLFTLGGE